MQPQVRLAVRLHGQERQRPVLLEREQLLEERPLLDVRLGHQFQVAPEPGEQLGVIMVGDIGRARQVQSDVLERRVAHLPRSLGVIEVRPLELEAQAAALADLGRVAAVEHEVRVALLGRHVAGVIQEVLPALGLEEPVGDVEQRFRKEERPPRSVAFAVDIEYRPQEPLRRRLVVTVLAAGVLAARPDSVDVLEMLGDLPVQVDIRENGLTAPGNVLLRILEHEHLGKLVHVAVRQTFDERREEDVDCIPADGAGEMPLQRGRELDHVGQ